MLLVYTTLISLKHESDTNDHQTRLSSPCDRGRERSFQVDKEKEGNGQEYEMGKTAAAAVGPGWGGGALPPPLVHYIYGYIYRSH